MGGRWTEGWIDQKGMEKKGGGWMDGWMDRWMDGRTDESLEGWMDKRWMDGKMDRSTRGGWMEEWMTDVRMEGHADKG